MHRRYLLFLVAGLSALSLDACASQECDFHSQCGTLFYCENGRCLQECQRDLDCGETEYCNEIGQCLSGERPDAGPRPDGGSDGFDAGGPLGFDAGPGFDAGVIRPGVDSGPPIRVDAGPPVGRGQYLDRCGAGTDCASGQCLGDTGGTNFCSLACSQHRDCASEHICGPDGFCHYDDTGAACSTASAASCELGLCIGNSTTGTGHCTRSCTDARDCPSGFACAAAGATRVCVEIEKPCSGPNACETGICLSVQGCTAECRTAADCPRRFSFLPAYTCARAFGSANPICVPPADALGPDPIGSTCPAVGTVTCRSGACNTGETTGPMCTQSCSQEGGCAPGLGCWPEVDIDEGSVTLLCTRSGSGSIGSTCATARDCDSGLCDASGYCSRLCTDDGLCPSDMSCRPVPGFGVSLCRR